MTMENSNINEIEYTIAKERVRQLKKFYASLLIFGLVFLIYSTRKYYQMGELNFLEWNNWSAIFWVWGIILIVKGFKIYFFNHSWERKMMDKELNK